MFHLCTVLASVNNKGLLFTVYCLLQLIRTNCYVHSRHYAWIIRYLIENFISTIFQVNELSLGDENKYMNRIKIMVRLCHIFRI